MIEATSPTTPENTPAQPPAPVASKTPESTPLPNDRLWTTDEVAYYLCVSPKTVFNRRKKGLPCVLVGGAVRFDQQKVKEYLTNNPGQSRHRQRQIVRKGVNQ